jgi:radical SAM superfamily enzyme YgiQ (UPF0313 family)
MARAHDQPVDVLFVNPPSPDGFVYIRDINRHGRSSWERMIWPQTNLAILAATVGEIGLQADIVDCIAEQIDWDGYREILRKTKPRYCFANLISVTYGNDVAALAEAKAISGAMTVAMGPHITANPEISVEESKDIDFVIRHEAEPTLAELLSLFEANPKPDLAELSKVAGLCFVPRRICGEGEDSAVLTAKRVYLPDLDKLPRARHDLLPLEKYWAPFLGNYTFIETSRGCPYRCTFCRQGVFYEWKFRTRSGKSLADEALHLSSLGVKNILFHADTFTADSQMVEDLCDRLIAAGSPIRWACNSHAKNLNGKPELIEKMKAAGCWMIAIGIESGDDQILKNIKKSSTVSLVKSTVLDIHAAGIQVWGYFVIGFPGETPETIEKTIQFSKSLPLTIAKFDIGAPYPGTEFYDFVTKNGFLNLDSYEEFDQNASAVVSYPGLSSRQIKAGVRRATREFYLQPRILWHVFKEGLKPRSMLAIILIIRDQLRLMSNRNHGARRAELAKKLRTNQATTNSPTGKRVSGET